MNREPEHELTAVVKWIELFVQQRYLSGNNKKIDCTKPLDVDYGLDSLDQVELIMELEKMYSVPLPDDMLNERFYSSHQKCFTINNLAKLVYDQLGEFRYKNK